MKFSSRCWLRGRTTQNGSVLIEASIALGLAVFLALMSLKASMLAVSGNQWTIMQTLSDAYMTRETALSHRVPIVEVLGTTSLWPDWSQRTSQTVNLGKVAGGRLVQGELTRFRMELPSSGEGETNLRVLRLYSVLSYMVGDKKYVKTRSTLRME